MKPLEAGHMLRSGLMGWMSLMLHTTSWSEPQRNTARHAFALYKTQLRPLIRDANVAAIPSGRSARQAI
jgi:hypothetical protein